MIAGLVLSMYAVGDAQEPDSQPQTDAVPALDAEQTAELDQPGESWRQSIQPFVPFGRLSVPPSAPPADEEGPLDGVMAVISGEEDGQGESLIENMPDEAWTDELSNDVEMMVNLDDGSDNIIRLGGWIDAGTTWNADSPSNRFNTPVLFNDRSNEFQLNQLYLYLDAPVTVDGTTLELGGRIDVLYGTDFRFLTVPGFEEHLDGTRRLNSEDHRFYGVAVPQWYVELSLPVLEGASIKAGHFYSIFGFDRVEAPRNFFYSRTYAFTYGQPFTHSGMLSQWNLNDSWTLFSGLTTGWDNLRHPRDDIGYLGGINWTSEDDWTQIRFAFHYGNDLTGVTVAGQPESEQRFNYTLALSHQLSDCLTWGIQHDFGVQEDGLMLVDRNMALIGFDPAHWHGVSTSLICEANEHLAAGIRFEWFTDSDLSRTLAPVEFTPGGHVVTGNDYFALTASVRWRVTDQITIRPEARWDWSDIRGNPDAPGGDPAFRVFDDRTSGSQILLSTDVIIEF